jgi:hypothetical protein
MVGYFVHIWALVNQEFPLGQVTSPSYNSGILNEIAVWYSDNSVAINTLQ